MGLSDDPARDRVELRIIDKGEKGDHKLIGPQGKPVVEERGVDLHRHRDPRLRTASCDHALRRPRAGDGGAPDMLVFGRRAAALAEETSSRDRARDSQQEPRKRLSWKRRLTVPQLRCV
jgi:hypothetical protein